VDRPFRRIFTGIPRSPRESEARKPFVYLAQKLEDL